jgi:tetratricopeptide (TPR) repeat protein
MSPIAPWKWLWERLEKLLPPLWKRIKGERSEISVKTELLGANGSLRKLEVSAAGPAAERIVEKGMYLDDGLRQAVLGPLPREPQGLPELQKAKQLAQAGEQRDKVQQALQAATRVGLDEKALALLETLLLLGKGDEAFHQQNFSAAAERYGQALSIAHTHSLKELVPRALTLVGAALGMGGEAPAALESFDEALALDPVNAQAWYNRGVALDDLARYQEALESYDKALALDPKDALAWNNRGIALGNLGRYQDALESYDKAVALDPKDALAWSNRGIALDNLGRCEDALESYDKALALDPKDAGTWNNRGTALGNLGRYQEALESCDKALALDPKDALAWYNRAISLGNLGQEREARESLRKAAALGLDVARKALDGLKDA